MDISFQSNASDIYIELFNWKPDETEYSLFLSLIFSTK